MVTRSGIVVMHEVSERHIPHRSQSSLRGPFCLQNDVIVVRGYSYSTYITTMKGSLQLSMSDRHSKLKDLLF